MTKFSTLAYSVLLIVLVGFNPPAQALANTCAELFSRTPGEPVFISENASPRVKAALAEIKRGWRIKLEQSDESGGFTPWALGATIHIPEKALKSEDALASYLETIVPLVNEAKRIARIDESSREVEKLDPESKRLLTNWFTKHDVRVQIKALADTLGESSGNKIFIDQTLARYPRVIGTVVHEIYHTTVSAKLTPQASATEISRAIWFAPAKSDLPKAYAKLHRADEFEARVKQMASLNFHKLGADAANIAATAELFRTEQRDTTELFLAFFDEVKITTSEDPGQRQRPALKLSLAGDALYVPLVRAGEDQREYARAALEKRKISVSN